MDQSNPNHLHSGMNVYTHHNVNFCLLLSLLFLVCIIFKATKCFFGKDTIPSPSDAILLLPAFWKDTVGMRVELNAVTLQVVPSVFLVWVGKL